MKPYQYFPSLAQWKSDSSVALAVRHNDIILARIDMLVEVCESLPRQRKTTLCDLYFTLDYWLQWVGKNSNMEKGRQKAVHALYVYVVSELCLIFRCTVNVLPRELEYMFGRELTATGITVDLDHKKAKYLERKDIDKFRLWFRNGMVYTWNWWETSNSKPQRVLANSSRTYNVDAVVRSEGRTPNVNYGPFIMTMGRNFYMALHSPGEANKFNGFYHSSYLAGEPVMGAGSMLIVNGKIHRIRSDSGHYKPIDTNVVSVLQALRMLGYPLNDIFVDDYLGKTSVKAEYFMSQNGDWNKLETLRDQNKQQSRDNFKDKEYFRNPPSLSGVGVELKSNPYEDN
jgi:hypothetical protein